MNNSRSRLIYLHGIKAMTRPLLRKMLMLDASLIKYFSYLPQDFISQFSIPPERAIQLYKDIHSDELKHKFNNDIVKYKIFTIYDTSYPPQLKVIPDPPLVLYMIGNPELMTKFPLLSVVGTRHPSQHAGAKINYIVGPLIERDWVIVSGMAKGIDGMAHELALVKNGYTIAVLGGGFHHIYPREHTSLFNKLAKSQLILSEYPPDTKPQRFHFPERNRIISGLSFGIIVIEAKEKSGSLITVEQALEQGREVYAVPDSPLQSQASGCHKMIQDGAKLVQNTYDILEDWDVQKGKWCRFLSDFKVFP